MIEETEENWQDCVAKTIELSPDCVTIYQMEVPYNTTIYKRMKEEGKLTAPVANWYSNAAGSTTPSTSSRMQGTPSPVPTPPSRIQTTPSSSTATASGPVPTYFP